MQGYVARKGQQWYAVIYAGLDPATGRERRRWQAAGTDRAPSPRSSSPAFYRLAPGRRTGRSAPSAHDQSTPEIAETPGQQGFLESCEGRI